MDGLAIAGKTNAWLPSGDLISNDTYFLSSNPYTTLTTPANARYPITVTAYNQNSNSIILASSRGYTRNENIKPDLAAPGYEVTCPLPGNQYGTATGTGAAAAHTTGIAAMLLEWAIPKGHFTSITGRDINKLLIRGAERQPGLTYPNRIWGYGAVNIYQTFETLRS